MSQVEQAQTIGLVSTSILTFDIPVGTTEQEIHFSGDDASSGDCVAGDVHLVVKKQAGMSPVVKLCTTDIWHNDFGGTPALSASVIGDTVVIEVPGVVGKTLDWTVTSGI